MNAIAEFPANLVLAPAVESIQLEDLYLSPMNPRQESDAELDKLLAQSLVACGQAQNLIGLRDDQGKVAVVAGGRRLRALQIAVKERADLASVMVLIAPDEDTALRMASAENSARVDMDATDEIRNFGKMRDTGASVAEIASVFGVTEARVYRRLSLASLPEEALDALKAGQISLDIAKALTLADSLDAITKNLPEIIKSRMSAHSVKTLLLKEAQSSSSRYAKFVGEKSYKAAGGTITTDLFGDEQYFNDNELLGKLYNEKLNKRLAQEKKKGWAWVEINTEHYVDSHKLGLVMLQYDKLALSDENQKLLSDLKELEYKSPEDWKEIRRIENLTVRTEATPEEMAVSGVVATVDWNGEYKINGPYIRAEESQAAFDAGIISSISPLHEKAGKDVEGSRNQLSQAVIDDVKSIRLHAFQNKLKENQKLALSLLAFSLSEASNNTQLFGLKVEAAKNVPSNCDGLNVDGSLVAQRENKHLQDAEIAFADFCQKSEAEIMEILVAGAVRTIHSDFGFCYTTDLTGLYGSIAKANDVREREIWTPTKDAFWGRVSSGYMERVFEDLTGYAEETEELKGFKKAKKAEKAEIMHSMFNDADTQAAMKLTAAQVDRIAQWMPEA